MSQTIPLLLLVVLISHTYAAPQLISFQDGKLGVNFAGYHAGVGIGGLLGGGAAGGLYAEAGTPHGQSARAGLGGVVSENGGSSGGLYAGATAGGNVKASAGLAGGVTAEKAAGAGYASAQAGNQYATSGMGGETSVSGASDFSFSGTQEVYVPVKPVHKKIHAEFNVDAINEVQPISKESEEHTEIKTNIEKEVVHQNVQPVVVKEVSSVWSPLGETSGQVNLLDDIQLFINSVFNEAITAGFNYIARSRPNIGYSLSQVYVEPAKTKVIQKEIIHTHYKPRRHHFRKTAFLGGYIGGQGDIVSPTVYKSVEPEIQKRVDVGAETSLDAEATIGGAVGGGAGTGHVYTKQVTYQKSPTFFADIFNIPISALKAVGTFLGNTAANTNISVQKTATVEAESKSLTSDPSSSSSLSSSSAHVSVETPNASKFIDDILAIPINTLGAVNKFLENNVAARKSVQIVDNGAVEYPRARLGPHARRRANKHVVVIPEESPAKIVTEE